MAIKAAPTSVKEGAERLHRCLCLRQAPWKPRCKSMLMRSCSCCQVCPGGRFSRESTSLANDWRSVAVSPLTSSCASCGFLGFPTPPDSGNEIETLPPLNKGFIRFKNLLLFFNRMILNSGRHALFSRPSPSRLSPGRNTVFVSVERIVQHLHRLLFGSVKREYGPIHSLDIVYVRWRPHEEKQTNQTKTTKAQTQQKQNKTKTPNQNRKNPHRRNGQVSSDANCSNVCASDSALHVLKQHRNQKKHNCKAPGKGAKRSSTRCGNPGSPQPGSRRSERDVHSAQQVPQSQDCCHAPHTACQVGGQFLGTMSTVGTTKKALPPPPPPPMGGSPRIARSRPGVPPEMASAPMQPPPSTPRLPAKFALSSRPDVAPLRHRRCRRDRESRHRQ